MIGTTTTKATGGREAACIAILDLCFFFHLYPCLVAMIPMILKVQINSNVADPGKSQKKCVLNIRAYAYQLYSSTWGMSKYFCPRFQDRTDYD